MQTRKNCSGTSKSEAVLAAVSIRWWRLGSQEKGAEQKARAWPWISGEYLFRDLLGRIPWNITLERRRVNESCLTSSRKVCLKQKTKKVAGGLHG